MGISRARGRVWRRDLVRFFREVEGYGTSGKGSPARYRPRRPALSKGRHAESVQRTRNSSGADGSSTQAALSPPVPPPPGSVPPALGPPESVPALPDGPPLPPEPGGAFKMVGSSPPQAKLADDARIRSSESALRLELL